MKSFQRNLRNKHSASPLLRGDKRKDSDAGPQALTGSRNTSLAFCEAKRFGFSWKTHLERAKRLPQGADESVEGGRRNQKHM